MLLHAIRLRNFRAYQSETVVVLGDLTGLVGRNDAGKSSIFDALEIFFEEAGMDPKDRCVHVAPDEPVEITCVFRNIPRQVVLDGTVETSLEDEFLLNADKHLEIRKVYSGEKMKCEVHAIAMHPAGSTTKDLLYAKNADLKKAAAALAPGADVDRRSNVDLRRAIRQAAGPQTTSRTEINLAKEGAKEIWSALQPHLPHFAVFRSDRASTDEDDQVQDPMRLAVRQALQDVTEQLASIQKQVEERAAEVARRTLEKLAALDERIASELKPRYRSEPKWETVFKLALDGENEIPINKRGSGVRRLVLLSFFQAEVERERSASNRRDVVYAIEEPETSQHPSNQVLLVEALKELATAEGTQVLLTTHVPALAGMLPVKSIRHVTQDRTAARMILEGDQILEGIARDLGVLPEYHNPKCKLIVCVEGPTDVEFLKGISAAVRQLDSGMPDLSNDVRVAILPAGGATLKDWITKRYLKDLGLPEVHIYDSDVADYKNSCDEVNARTDGLGSWATVTNRREIENYYPVELVNTHFGISVTITDQSDVEADVRTALRAKRFRGQSIKKSLAEHVAPRITASHLKARGDDAEVLNWFDQIRRRLG